MTKNDGWFVVDCAELRTMRDQLHGGISGLDQVAMQVPSSPEAGMSSAKVADTLASITRSVAGIISGVENLMIKISASAEVYEHADRGSETDLRHAGVGAYMAGELNTEVTSDPASCRAAAAWLGRITSGVQRAVQAMSRARNTSENCWQGATGEAFRESLHAFTRDADSLVDITRRMQVALEVLLTILIR